MNYTDWLISEYPHLQNASSAETYSYITTAKLSSKYSRNIAGLLTTLVLILPLNVLFSSLGVQPFENLSYWLSFGLVVFVSRSISNLFEQKIMKAKLRSLVKAKYGM